MTPKGKRTATLAAHPFQKGPNGIDEVVLGVAMEAPHPLVLVSLVLEPHQRPAPSEGLPEGSPHLAQYLRGR